LLLGRAGRAIAVDSLGAIHLAGTFSGTVDFGSGKLVSDKEVSIYLARVTRTD
jgi:hypothetical protein